MKIHLKCCCGAEIEVTSDWEKDARKYADDWQDRHKDCKPTPAVINTNPMHLWNIPPIDYTKGPTC